MKSQENFSYIYIQIYINIYIYIHIWRERERGMQKSFKLLNKIGNIKIYNDLFGSIARVQGLFSIQKPVSAIHYSNKLKKRKST